MEIIPAIDIIDGKCVRLTQGDFAQKTIYDSEPLELAKMYEAIGIRRLHLVDLDGAKQGKVQNIHVLEQIANQTKLIIDFGGGLKSDKDLEMIFNAGASIAAIGSMAVKEPALFQSWLKQYGSEKIMLGADVRDEKIAVNGWLTQTDLSVFELIQSNIEAGLKTIFCTDISRDGLLRGPSVELYKKIIQEFSGLNLIASGGVSSVDDLKVLQKIGCSGVIIGKAIYEEKIKLDELKPFLKC